MSSDQFAIEQYYQHLQHVENYRFWFTNTYFIFSASLFGYVFRDLENPLLGLVLSLIMVGFSYVGIRMTVKTGAVVAGLSTSIGDLLREITKHVPYPIRGKGSISQAYVTLYQIVFVIWTLIATYYLWNVFQWLRMQV